MFRFMALAAVNPTSGFTSDISRRCLLMMESMRSFFLIFERRESATKDTAALPDSIAALSEIVSTPFAPPEYTISLSDAAFYTRAWVNRIPLSSTFRDPTTPMPIFFARVISPE